MKKRVLLLAICLCLLAVFAVTVSAEGETTLPEIGVFSRPVYDAAYYLEHGVIDYIPGEGAVVYVMTKNGFDDTPTSIARYPSAFSGTTFALGNGKYALQITVPASMSHDYGYWLPVDGGGVMLNLNDLTTAVSDDIVMVLECDAHGTPLSGAEPTSRIDHGLAGTHYYQICVDAKSSNDVSAADCTFVPYEHAVQRGLEAEQLSNGLLKLTFPNRFGGGVGGFHQGENKLTELVFETEQWRQTEVTIDSQSYTLTFGTGDNGNYFDRGPYGSTTGPSEIPMGVALQDSNGTLTTDLITNVTFSVERDSNGIGSVLQQPRKQQSGCWDGKIKLADKLGDAYIYAHITLKLSDTVEKTISLRMYALVTEGNGQGGNQGGNQEPAPIYLLECDKSGKPVEDAVRTNIIDHGYKTTKHYLVYESMQAQSPLTGYTAFVQAGKHEVQVLQNGVLRIDLTGQFDNWCSVFIKPANGPERLAVIRRNNQDQVPVTIGGKEYTLLFGACRGEGLYMSWWLGDGIIGSIAERGYTTAERGVILYENYGDVENMKAAPAEIQKKITNVVFTERYDEKNMLSVTQPAVQTDDGYWNGMYRIKATPGDAHAVAVVTIEGVEEPIYLWEYARMVPVEIVTIECGPNMTIKDISEMIAVEFPKYWNAGKAMKVELAPGKTYEGDLVVKIKDWEPMPYNELPITISGTFDQDGKPSTIVGSLVLHHGFNLIENVAFQAPESTGETVGVIHHQAEVSRIERCSFTGYDVAIDCASAGGSHPNAQNLFLNNGTALRINSSGKDWGHQKNGMMHNVFIENDVAVEIVQMPDHIPQYLYRIGQCDFVENDRDFVVEGGKNFYFHDNFYGNRIQQGQYVTDRAAHVKGKVNSGIRWRNPVSSYWDAETVWWQDILEEYGIRVKKEKSAAAENERLLGAVTVDGTSVSSTAILNEDTGSLLVSGENIEADMTVEVTDQNDTVLGVWQFS